MKQENNTIICSKMLEDAFTKPEYFLAIKKSDYSKAGKRILQADCRT